MTAKSKCNVAVLGIFVADLAFRASKLPVMGETLLGSSFASGPGGKGSNQAVAAATAGACVSMITKLGKDTFADMANDMWTKAGVINSAIVGDVPTGAAMIYVNDVTGDNAIIVVPGSGGTLSAKDIDQSQDLIKNADVFITQLEQPHETALYALKMAKQAGVITIFNPAPAPKPIDENFYQYCDYITPNESEAAGLTGVKVATIDQAKNAAGVLLEKGVGCAIITLGERGAYIHNKDISEMIEGFTVENVVETTGAGDAFNGSFATALGEGKTQVQAVRFACACASLSVTKAGAASAMPTRKEIDLLLE